MWTGSTSASAQVQILDSQVKACVWQECISLLASPSSFSLGRSSAPAAPLTSAVSRWSLLLKLIGVEVEKKPWLLEGRSEGQAGVPLWLGHLQLVGRGLGKVRWLQDVD